MASSLEGLDNVQRQFDLRLSKVAHDIRDPLQTVIGYTQLLTGERAGPLNDKQRRYVEQIIAGAMQVLAVVDNAEASRSTQVSEISCR